MQYTPYNQSRLQRYLSYLQAERLSIANALSDIDTEIKEVAASIKTDKQISFLPSENPEGHLHYTLVEGPVEERNERDKSVLIPTSFKEAKSWFERISFIISSFGGSSTTAQIVDWMIRNAPEGLEGDAYRVGREKLINKISSIISTYAKKGKFKKERRDNADTVYSI